MKELITITAILFLCLSSSGAQGSENLFHGIRLTTYRVDLRQQTLRLISKDEHGSPVRNAKGVMLIASKEGRQLSFATNSGIFNHSLTPLGLHIESGIQITPINLSHGEGNFFMQPNAIFSIANNQGKIVRTSEFVSDSKTLIATQSGPALLLDNIINSSFTPNSRNRVIRSGVGIRGNSEIYFAISDEPINFYDFARFFRDFLKCSSALYLDGVISSMYIPALNRTDTSGNFSAMFAVFN